MTLVGVVVTLVGVVVTLVEAGEEGVVFEQKWGLPSRVVGRTPPPGGQGAGTVRWVWLVLVGGVHWEQGWVLLGRLPPL